MWEQDDWNSCEDLRIFHTSLADAEVQSHQRVLSKPSSYPVGSLIEAKQEAAAKKRASKKKKKSSWTTILERMRDKKQVWMGAMIRCYSTITKPSSLLGKNRPRNNKKRTSQTIHDQADAGHHQVLINLQPSHLQRGVSQENMSDPTVRDEAKAFQPGQQASLSLSGKKMMPVKNRSAGGAKPIRSRLSRPLSFHRLRLQNVNDLGNTPPDLAETLSSTSLSPTMVACRSTTTTTTEDRSGSSGRTSSENSLLETISSDSWFPLSLPKLECSFEPFALSWDPFDFHPPESHSKS